MTIRNQLAGKTILIIDDSPESITILGNALPKYYKRKVALNGDQAFKLLSSSEKLPDLILLDVIMPDIDGYELCKRFKKEKKLKKIPIIFLSSLSDVKDKIRAFQNGGVDYIQKPFEIAEVQARVKTHLKLYDLQIKLENHNKQLNKLVEEKTKEVTESQLATIYGLAKLAERRDDETGEHINRVQVYCRLIAERMRQFGLYRNEIDEGFISNLEKASSMHDIGKVGVRDSLLLKPGKLSAQEFEEMKAHTTIGANTLREVAEKYPNNRFIEIGIEITQYHHEKWDGSGYPKGLIGKEIPLSARIMALVDVYDALRSKRVYKKAFPHKKAREIIVNGRGKHFDPRVVDVFIAYEQDFEMIFRKFSSRAATKMGE